MRLGNIGNKDEYGKQRRIEHRGKYLRISRTGAISVRAQAKAAGFNFTGNAKRGVRVSRTVAKNTQVAMQNGRFVLRGRYGKGPTKMNVSKTGATVSTRNRMGTINWIKPGWSSAKIAGVQVRGKNAVALQAVYLVIAGIAAIVQIAWTLIVLLFQALVAGATAASEYQQSRKQSKELSLRDERNARLEADAKTSELQSKVDGWDKDQALGALLLIFCAWGRGAEALPMAGVLHERIRQEKSFGLLNIEMDTLVEMSHLLYALRETIEAEDQELILLACVATRAQEVIEPETLPETIMQIDELALKEGERTEGQEEMLEVMSDFAALTLEQEKLSEPCK